MRHTHHTLACLSLLLLAAFNSTAHAADTAALAAMADTNEATATAATTAATTPADFSYSGNWRTLLNSAQINTVGPAAQTGKLQPGLLTPIQTSVQSELEMKAQYKNWHTTATLHTEKSDSNSTRNTGWLNEFYGNLDQGAWQLSAGKKIIAWDVGYGFRPNDVIQQEKRRSLISQTAIGKPLASLDFFTADQALSLVWVNPAQNDAINNIEEQAIAARWYQRSGNVDWHGFARYGKHTQTSLGAAFSWVASDAVELHGSLRVQQKAAILQQTAFTGLARSAPWQWEMQNQVSQLLLGANLTTEDQHSFFVEYWYDGGARSQSDWRQWLTQNQQLLSMGQQAAWRLAAAANLAWQNNAFNASSNLRRQNLFARWSWQRDAWQTAVDVLWMPEDGGRITTFSQEWQGDRWHWQTGLRVFNGPQQAIARQLPNTHSAYVSATWAF